MGFREGNYATVWEVIPQEKSTKIRISTTRKNKNTGEYEQDFSGFILCIGNAREAALKLKEKDRIKILGCDVSSFYDKDKKLGYNTFKMFDFEMADAPANAQQDDAGESASPPVSAASAAQRRPSFDFEGDSE